MQAHIPPPDETAELLSSVQSLYDEGRYGDALRAGMPKDLRAWSGTDARILAARLASRLGAPRLSQALVFRAHRDDPSHPEAVLFMASLLFARRGAWHCLDWLGKRAEGSARTGHVLLLEARSLAMLRDFERALVRLDEAEAAGCDGRWLEAGRSAIADLQDDFEKAMEISEAALARWPTYRPLIMIRAAQLASIGRVEEAYETISSPHLPQSWELLSQRAEIAFSLGRYAACEDDLAAAHAAALLLETPVERSLANARAEAAYLQGAHRRAERYAKEAKTEFGDRFARALAELEDGEPPPRKELSGVAHIRQHHVTCMPSSLAMVTAYHGDPVDHIEVAEAICYAGTPLHRAVEWVRERGCALRQLDVSFSRARALIDAGFPVVLSTAGTVGAHSNVVVGYDLARRALLIRDPSTPSLVEMPEERLEKQAWYGPHGLVLAPAERAAELEAIDLGESAALWELSHEVSARFEEHDVEGVRSAIAELEARAPGSRLALLAACDLARYEGRLDEWIQHLDALLALHPETTAWVLRRGEAMRGVRPLAERLAYWSSFAHLEEPALLESLAEDLRQEVGEQRRARGLLRKALRLAPQSAMAHHVLADLGASRGEDDAQVLASYRFGACLAMANEHFVRGYYEHARACGREEEAFALMRRRAEDADDRARGPAQTLFDVYLEAGHPERGVEVLRELAARRPEDGDLALVLVHAHMSAGDPEAAAEWLERARAHAAHEGNRLLAESQVARARGDLPAARDALERALEREPWRVAVLAPLADVLLELHGADAAAARVEAAFAAEPEDGAILAELSVWLRGRDDERALELVQARVEARPSDHWARRELAVRHAAVGDLEGAIELAREAVAATPFESVAFGVLGSLCASAGDIEGARAALRRAVELSVDNAVAIRRLSTLGAESTDVRDDIRFVLERLERRVSAGPGIVEAAAAATVLPHAEQRERLDRLLDMASHRPDAWEAVIRSRLDGGAVDEAKELCSRAVGRFPRWFGLRRLEADVHRLRGAPEDEESTLRRLVEIAPVWAEPRVRLSVLARTRGAFAEARAVIEEGLRRSPRAPELRSELAALLWHDGDQGGAFGTLFEALEDGSLDERGFERLASWGERLGRGAELEACLREKLEKNPRVALPWFRLAVVLSGSERTEDRVVALREALRRAPRYERAADLLAVTLTQAGRYREALAACPPEEWVGPVPHTMLGRRAWVLAASGRLEEAIQAMRRLLDDTPEYAWGRLQLCDWLDRMGRAGEFLEQAERLVVEAPTDATSHVYVADARRLSGDGPGAAIAFARALELDPSHPYAATQLLGMRLEAEDIEGAEAIFELSQYALPRPEALAAAVRIEAARGRWREALARLEELVGEPVAPVTLQAALSAFAEGPRLDRAFALIEERFEEPAAGTALGIAWADACESRGIDRSERVFRRRDALGPAGHAALSTYVEHLAASRRSWSLFAVWLWHGRWMRRVDALWGAFGYALRALGWVRLCLWWMRDHGEREGALPWMLLNVVTAAWWIGRRPAAESAVAQALAAPRDHASDRHLVWALFHRALRGEPIEEDLATLRASGTERGILHLVEALREAAAAVDASDDDFVAAVGPPLEAARALARSDGTLLVPLRSAREHILRDRPHLRGALRS